MRFRLKTDTKSYEIGRNARSIASLDSENDAFITASSDHTLTNKQLSYDQLTGVPIRSPAHWNEADVTHISFIQNKPTIPVNTDTQSDWDETDTSSAAHILNKPTIPVNTDTKSDWDETDTSSAAWPACRFD